MRKIIIITFIMMFTACGWSELVNVSKNQGQIIEKVTLETIGGEKYLSVNDVLKVVGGVKYWYPTTNKVLLEINGEPIELFLNHENIRIRNSLQKRLTSPPRIYQGKVMVPLDFLTSVAAPAAGLNLKWNPGQRLLTSIDVEATIVSMHFYSYPERTRIVFETMSEYKPDMAVKDWRIDYRFKDAGANLENISRSINDSRIKQVKATQIGNDVNVSLILNTRSVLTKTLYLKNPYRVVIDLSDDSVSISSADSGPSAKNVSHDIRPPLITPPGETVPSVSPVIDLARSQPIKTIVIDPGHGGKDPGAVGYGGLKEKDVTLAVAKILKDLILQRLGLRVILTRSGDYFVPLRKRTEIANNNKADLFISVHVNASLRSRAQGFETYYLGKAQNEDARAVAALENAVVRFEKDKKKLTDLDFILWDMAQNDFRASSFEIANLVQKELDARLSTENRKVKTAPFYVLNGAYMPAVLVEIGFITNRKEEKMLKGWKHQKRLAEAIYNSVYSFKQRQAKLLVGAKQ